MATAVMSMTETGLLAAAAAPTMGGKVALAEADVAMLKSKLVQFTDSLTGVPELATIPQTQQQQQAAKTRETDDDISRGVAGMVTGMFQGKEGPPGFAGKNVPGMALEAYVSRVVRYLDMWGQQHHGLRPGTGERCALMAVELLNRLCDAGCGVCPRTAHRMFLAATLVSAKSTEDFVVSNRFIAKVGGVPLEEMNRLEMELCELLRWRIVVSHDDVAALRHSVSEPRF